MRKPQNNAVFSGLAPLLAAVLFFVSLPLGADTFTFKARRMNGGRAAGREITVLTGNAEVQSDNLVIKSDRIELAGKDNQFIECYGNVTGEDSEKQIYFSSDRLSYDRKTHLARLEGNASLEDRENSVVTRGRYIEYNDEAEVAVFQISVRMFKNDIVCRSEYAIYRRKAQILDLSGFPVVYKKTDEFRADKIRVDLETDDVSMEGSVSGAIKE